MRVMRAEEGTKALWSGMAPGLQRQFVFSGLRIGLYETVRDTLCGPMKPGQNPSLLQKLGAGIVTGALAITVANPTDLAKVRL
jgi:solute carrier family 25 (mitochondrial uncoupling protein), member 8/9